MKPSTMDKLKKFCNFVGLCACFITLSAQFYLGNLSVYTMSYVRSYVASDADVNTPWVISLVSIGWAAGMMPAGYVSGCVGQKWTIVLACAFVDVSVFSSYFLIQYSAQAFNLIFGILFGVGGGLMTTAGLENIVSYFPTHPGFPTAIVLGFISVGGVLFNQVITLYINPDNLTPYLYVEQEKYFSQPEVLDRVTSVFLVIGCVNLCLHTIGIFMITPRMGRRDEVEQKGVITIDEDIQSGEFHSSIKSRYEACETVRDEALPLTSEIEKTAVNELKPMEALRTKIFYVLWSALGFCEFACIVHFNCFKSYGQIWIHDDHFMATLASLVSLGMGIARPLWGLTTDKCNIKVVLLSLPSTLTIIPFLWYFTPMVNRWLYLIWTILYGCSATSVFVVFPVATLRFLGSQHLSHNYGLIMSSRILINLIAPVFMNFIVKGYGYFYLFLTVGCCNLVEMILIICVLPRTV